MTVGSVSTPTPPTVRPPIKTIRNACLNCTGGCLKEILECPRTECFLHDYRMGKRPPNGTTRFTPLQAIKRYYRDFLMLGNAKEVRLCPMKTHPLWIYRFGKRPTPEDIAAHLAALFEAEDDDR